MKKNLFLLFSLYFFVMQPVIIGIIRQEVNMFFLALINLVCMVLIALIYRLFSSGSEDVVEKPRKERKVLHEEKENIVQTARAYETAPAKTPASSLLPFVLSVVVGLVLFGFGTGGAVGLRIFIAVIGAIIIFIIFTRIRGAFKKGFRKLLAPWFYIILLGIAIVITLLQFIFQTNQPKYGMGEYLQTNITSMKLFGGQTAPTDQNAYYMSGEGTVLSTGVDTTASEQIDTLLSGTASDVIASNEEATTTESTQFSPGESLHMIDMIKYLIEKYNLPLITKKDVKFTYMSQSSPDYPYFRTAYANALIGSSTNPTKLALCDTYITMRGLLEKRNVSYTKANVLQKFRDYAKANDELNGCKQGAVLKEGNL